MSTLLKFYLAPHTLQFEDGGSYPAQRTHKVFQVKDRSAGGKIHVENLGIKTRKRNLVFEDMSKVDYDGLVDWFYNIVNAGETDFEFTDEYGETGTVKIMNDEIDFGETSLERYAGSVLLEYV